MILKSFLLKNGNLQCSTDVSELMGIKTQRTTEIWYDIQDTEIDELQRFLSVLDLHPLMLNRCLDKSSTPGVISFGGTVMLEYPVSSDFDGFEQSYISIILQYPILITIRHNTCPVLDDFMQEYVSRSETGIIHLVQLLYLIIDEITDLSVQAETKLRDKVIEMSRKLADNPATVKEEKLNDLRWEVEKLVWEPAKIKDNLLRWKERNKGPEIGGRKWERSGRNTTRISRRMPSSYRMQVQRQ